MTIEVKEDMIHNRHVRGTNSAGNQDDRIENEITQQVIGAAIDVHRQFGPGLLESVYEECLAHEMGLREIPFER